MLLMLLHPPVIVPAQGLVQPVVATILTSPVTVTLVKPT